MQPNAGPASGGAPALPNRGAVSGIGRRIGRIIRGKLHSLRIPLEAPEIDSDPHPTLESARDPRTQNLAILELPPTASAAEIKSAYRRLCGKYHPDRFANDPEKAAVANTLLAEINRAYDALARGQR